VIALLSSVKLSKYRNKLEGKSVKFWKSLTKSADKIRGGYF